MKICLMTSIFPPRIAGPSTQTYHMAKLLAEKGIEVVVVTFGKRNSIHQENGFKVYYLKNFYKLKPRLLSVLLCYTNALFSTLRILNKESPDILHHQTGVDGAFCLITGILSKLFGIPSFIKYAGDMVWEKICRSNNLPPIKYENIFSYNLKARILTFIERWILNNFTFIWGISSFQIDSLLNIHHIPRNKIIFLPNSICMDSLMARHDFPKNKHGIVILTICRFARWKRIDNAILALSRIKDDKVQLKIIGGENTSIEEELKMLVYRLGLKNRVSFVGAVSPIDIPKYYEYADIFLLPTIHEPCSIALIEAMAAGLPIVTTNVGGNPDLVTDGQEGFLVEPDDVDGMAKKLQIFIDNPELRLRAGRLGMEKAKKHSLEKNIHLFVDLYNRMLSSSL